MSKTKRVDVKANVDEKGYITGYASTFTREPDWAGDVVAKGAFADWLNHVHEDGVTVPMLYNHDQSLDSFIGKVTDIREDDHGLLFTAEFDATEKAQRARELAMDGRLAKFSFAYMILDQGPVTLEDGRKANELRKLDVDEVSLVLSPCNPDTSVVDVKSGRRNSKADADELRSIREHAQQITQAIDGLLADEEDADEPDGGPEPDANAEEPETANAEEQEAKDAGELERAKQYAAAVAAAIETLKE
jgi:HK97 family phage prohead protease